MTVGQVPPVPPPPPGAPVKKTNVWMWVGIGCGVILLLALGTCFAGGMFLKNKVESFASDMEKNPAKAAAELAVRMNPDIEMVSSDETTMTIRNKQTGEEITVNFEDAKEGKFTFGTKEGEASIDISGGGTDGEPGRMTVTGPGGEVASYGAGGNVPTWVPSYPGGQVTGVFDANSAEGHTGTFTVTTSDPVASVMAFYEEKLKAAGFKVEKMTYEGDTSGGTISATLDDQSRAATVMLSTGDTGTQAIVSFNEKP